jgi:hypothetical protein
MVRILTILLVLFPAVHLFGQQERGSCRTIKDFNMQIPLDSLTVLPESIRIDTAKYVGLTWQYDISSGLLLLVSRDPPDSVEVCYTTIPYRLHEVYYNRSLEEYLYERAYRDTVRTEESLAMNREELFPTDQISKSGTLSRGISFGNTQNAVLNSALNLQLDGKLSDNLNIRASITDQNVPFEPEGNTAQIQDFDNIFLELYNDQFNLRGGDIVLRNKPSHFLKYYKNVQGGQASVRYNLGDKSSAVTGIGVSVAKGKFASIALDVQEGVAGPYRIRVPGSTDFIIILANSEKVYLDGKLLSRGFNNDYIIDYNKAEIQFTGRVLITKFSRVRIDVEYSDRNYSRRIVAANHSQTIGRANVFFNYYSEKDNPNRPLTFTLNDQEKALMRSVGDNLDSAVRISAEQVDYNPDLILYSKVDTLDTDGRPVTIFQYSTDPEAELYKVNFSDVGPGNGSYIRLQSSINGRVYAWVGSLNGQPQGSYEPVSRIPAPNRKDMITVGGDFSVTKYEKGYAEFAASTNDVNLFSDLDGEDNRGNAFRIGFMISERPLNFLDQYTLDVDINHEFNNAYFNPIDRFRYIEFNRDWNYRPTEQEDRTAENIFSVSAAIARDTYNKVSYRLVKRQRGEYVDGFQHYVELNKKLGRLQLNSDAFFMNNNTVLQDAGWKRLNADLHYTSRLFVPGYAYIEDRNVVRDPASDSIVATAMNFSEHNFYIRSNDTLKTQFGISYAIREDQAPLNGSLVRGDASRTARFNLRSIFGNYHNLNVIFTYRNNKNFLVAEDPVDEETVIVRADWLGRFARDHIRTDLSYAVGNGRELKREFVFIQTTAGEGTHTWRDDNGDGVQDLSEFYLAVNPDERNYIKIFVPTDEFVFAYENNYNHRINLEMPRSWKQSGGFKGFLARFSNVTSLSVIKRVTNSNLAARFLPFYNRIPEADILSVRESVRSRVFYNRANTGFAFDAGLRTTANRQLLTNGFEDRRDRLFSSNIRWTFNRFYSMKLFGSTGKLSSASDFLDGRNYAIDQYRLAPEFAWQPNNNFRVSLLYAFSDKQNVSKEPGGGTAASNELIMDLRYSKAIQHNVTATFRYINIDFTGVENSPAGYELLEALRPGRNVTWNLIAQKKIINGLQLTLNYEGRSSEGSTVVHIGRMQVTALF